MVPLGGLYSHVWLYMEQEILPDLQVFVSSCIIRDIVRIQWASPLYNMMPPNVCAEQLLPLYMGSYQFMFFNKMLIFWEFPTLTFFKQSNTNIKRNWSHGTAANLIGLFLFEFRNIVWFLCFLSCLHVNGKKFDSWSQGK